VVVVNRRERRLAARLGVEWVGVSPDGWVEVCLGDPGCGCGERTDRKPRSGEDRPHAAPAPESTEEPWPTAG